MATILIADDDSVGRQNIARFLKEEGFSVEEAPDGDTAMQLVNDIGFDVILTDLKMPGADGLSLLQHTRRVSPQAVIILMTGFASVEGVIEAFRLGVHDYIIKPLIFEDVLQKVNRYLELKKLSWEVELFRREANQISERPWLIGQSVAIQNIVNLISKVASTSSTVLICGESGAGKEVVARAVHLQSPERDKIFLPVNCSAIPDTLLDSQLFGHNKGAFTGAVSAQAGLFQRAQGGTIFLDEIGELPLTLQPKLLRVLETKEIMPLGSSQPVKLDVRIIAATNRELGKEVAEGRFREDLFYRLNVINITLPPLRERRDDIPFLVEHLLRRNNKNLKKNYKGVETSAMKVLMSLPWKGNVRELDNVLERAMILGNGEWITTADLPSENVATEGIQEDMDSSGEHSELRKAVDSYEKNYIETVLKETGGDRSKAAHVLGLSRSSLYRKIEKLGINLEWIDEAAAEVFAAGR